MIPSLVGFAVVLAFIFLRVPIALAMGLVGVVGFAFETNMSAALSMSARIVTESSRDYGLSVIPLFVLMGLFVNESGMSREIYRAAHAFLGHLRGGLAMATIVACGVFAAISGSSLATVATMSRVTMPEMRRFGYDDGLSTASIAAGGTLGILIPPSVILVMYGLLTQTSIIGLFLAGLLPGLIGIVFYLAAVAFVVKRNPDAGPCGERSSWMQRWVALRGIGAVLALFVMMIGGLYGIFNWYPLNLTFSPTEAAGMGASGTFLIALLRRRLSWASTLKALVETAITTAGLFAILMGAWIFSNFVNYAGLPETLVAIVTEHNLPPLAVIGMILVIYLLLGCVFESLSMIVLTVPVFFPVVVQLGMDPIWFGIVVVIVTEISLITPPVGLNVFIMKSVLDDVPTSTIFKGVTPFWIVDILRLTLIVLVPPVALVLPWIVM
ncbi:C4-dicarboxylate ABC transporter permease [Sulfitobacter sp. EhC04]|uniref:TRAP transporter large permease n=1 Tax=Sulfitobacter sp. EhC04 TaxID=1849168 RepID=UPI0007F53B05|nr:TRAP transporter large permease [Sulfitobacter sp. EhC04]OAN75666.1 C4-dicarboxylate ABC transporter permease [Sulfitobacter sp. EhC04]